MPLLVAALSVASFDALAAQAFEAIEVRLVGQGGPQLTVDGTDRRVDLAPAPILSSEDFVGAGDVVWVEGHPGFEVALSDAGSAKLARLSKENIGKSLAFIIDGKLLMTPTIRDPIVAEGFLLTTSGGADEARRLAAIVSGALAGSPR